MRFLVTVLTVLAVTFSGCSNREDSAKDDEEANLDEDPGSATTPVTHVVRLVGSAFEPRVINITAGDTVRWQHADGDTPHNVESSSPAFDSHPNCKAPVPAGPVCMVNGDTFEVMFLEAGSVEYLCELHNGMTGTISVVGAPPTNSTGKSPERPGRP